MTTSARQKRVLLVDGYIRQHEKILNLSSIVPISINSIIFDFQLLLEKWSTKWSNSAVNIIRDASIAEMKYIAETNWFFNKRITFYGDHVVKYGESFVWNLEIIKGENCKLSLGITLNKPEILIGCQHSHDWYFYGGYVWEASSGYFGYDNGRYDKYSNPAITSEFKFISKGVKLQIKFNWKENLLKYIVNGHDHGNALTTGTCGELKNDETHEFTPSNQGKIAVKIDSESY